MKTQIRKIYHRHVKPVYAKAKEDLVLQINAQMYRERVWIIGDGRSGTTWLQEAINFDQSYRQVFEPFHPREVEVMHSTDFFRYLRPGQDDKTFEKLCKPVFDGTFSHKWSTSINREKLNDTKLYQNLLVKDVFAHLFAKWAKTKFPEIKIILLLRHPFAVALSKQKLSHWHWMTEPTDFLNQKDLVQDYLEPFIAQIEQADGYFEKQVLIWSIIHHVLFSQFEKGEILPVFYEDLCLNFESEMARIFAFIKSDFAKAADLKIPQKDKKLSRTSLRSNSDQNVNRGFDSWCSKLSKEEFDMGLKVLSSFGFDQIYSENPIPNSDSVDRFLAKN